MSAQHRIERESHKDPDTLEREIEAKRRDISGIVDELEHKLSPGELFDRALVMARGNGGEFMHNLGDTIKANPVPTLLTSIGLLWLMTGSRQRHAHAQPMYHEPADIYGTDGERHSRLGDAAASLRERASSMKEGVSGRMHDASHKVSEAGHRLSDAGHRLSEGSQRAARRMQQGARSARDGFSDMLVEQPLAVGAIGIAAGALLAAMLPPTRQEDEWLGAASDRTRQKAREMAGSGLDAASEKMAATGTGEVRASGGGAPSPTGSDSRYGGSGQTH